MACPPQRFFGLLQSGEQGGAGAIIGRLIASKSAAVDPVVDCGLQQGLPSLDGFLQVGR